MDAQKLNRRYAAELPGVLLLLLFFQAALTLAAPAQDLQVTASVSANIVGAQDQFQLTVTVSGSGSEQAQEPRLPRFQGLRVVQGPNLSTQFQWINGRSSSSRSYIYTLLPEKEGQFTIDPIEVTVGGKTFKTQALSVRVTSASRGSAPQRRSAPLGSFGEDPLGNQRAPQPSGDELFVTAELDRATAYPSQQVTLTYHLYTQVNVTGLQLQENPPLTGFWVENLDVENKPTGVRKVINGREVLDYTIKKQALFPNSPGKLKIPSSTFAISVRSAGDFFGMLGQSETVYRKTKEVALDVKPLPAEHRPEGFGNAVGSFTLESELSKSEVAAGDAVSLKIKLAGIGNLKEIPDIPLPAMPDLTIYSSKREDNVRPSAGDQIGGDKVWEYVIVPKAPGDHAIPALTFSYFDPDRGSYRTAATLPISLKVTRGADSGSGISGLSGINKQNLTRQGNDIDFIKLAADDLETRREPIYRSFWFYLLAGLPLLFNAGAFLYQRERARESGNVVLARSRRARRTALARLRQAEKAGRMEPRRFYDEAARALAGFLGDKFNLPDIEVTADSLERTMADRHIGAGMAKETVAALQECDFGRFVSAPSSPERRRALAERIRKIMDVLERQER
jgi:hypothetical protein